MSSGAAVLSSGLGELPGLVVAALLDERVGEHAGDRRAERAVAHGDELLAGSGAAAPPRPPGRRRGTRSTASTSAAAAWRPTPRSAMDRALSASRSRAMSNCPLIACSVASGRMLSACERRSACSWSRIARQSAIASGRPARAERRRRGLPHEPVGDARLVTGQPRVADAALPRRIGLRRVPREPVDERLRAVQPREAEVVGAGGERAAQCVEAGRHRGRRRVGLHLHEGEELGGAGVGLGALVARGPRDPDRLGEQAVGLRQPPELDERERELREQRRPRGVVRREQRGGRARGGSRRPAGRRAAGRPARRP